MNKQPVIGISGCLTGSSVRFDGGHKQLPFAMDELAPWVTFKPICPEMAIGLSSPRPALRLVRTDKEQRFRCVLAASRMTMSRAKWRQYLPPVTCLGLAN